ncbi:MAG: phenylalanine--tRNA ligase subunit beta [Deltaproteobacteria bacterium]|nr:phenylalanine--tRNA ligase subunit beta [Deltaproteobacteria bacterium]
MLISLKWLNEHVDIADITPDAIAQKLTMAGLEVEGIEEKHPAFSGVIVARVVDIEVHSDANRLLLCQIFTGTETVPVVCGADNIAAGSVVPLANVGATLPGREKIGASSIRGVVSHGMLCSEEELGIGSDNSGIMLLPENLPLGRELAEVLNLGDTTLNVSITPNRADCYSIIGIAREVAALFDRPLKEVSCELKQVESHIAEFASVKIDAPHLCPRYSAMMIAGVKIGQSPLWMRQRLEAVGIRAISNVVDVTNYVMMEMGQPLHAFDYELLAGGKIIVRSSQDGEKFVSLDGKERILRKEILMICDAEKPVAIAGIMGGDNSEICPETKTVLLESAYFNPVSIRKSARYLGMGTDASLRFEKGIDPNGVLTALKRAAYLIAQTAGGVIYNGCIDEYPQRVEVAQGIQLRENKMASLIGMVIPQEEVMRIFTSLGMECSRIKEGFLVNPPSYRVDITREADLIEEVVRIYGYDRVATTLPTFAAAVALPSGREKVEEVVSDVFSGYGYSQILTFSFINPKAVDLLNLPLADERRNFVVLRNPLVEDHGVMRTTLVYSALQTLRNNVYSGNTDLKLFEIGRVFFSKGIAELPREENRLCAVVCGMAFGQNCHFGKSPAGYYDVKGAVEGLFSALSLRNVSWRGEVTEPFLHPYRSAGIFVDEQKVGFIGELHPEVLARFDLNVVPTVLECSLDLLTELVQDTKKTIKALPKFPSSYRDVSFLVEEAVTFFAIEGYIAAANEQLLEKTTVFDVFRGKGVAAGKKSMAVRFVYRSSEKTLTEEEIKEAHERVLKALVQNSGAELRG